MNQIENSITARGMLHPNMFLEDFPLSESSIGTLFDYIYIVRVDPGPQFRCVFANQLRFNHTDIELKNMKQLLAESENNEQFQLLVPFFQKAAETKSPLLFREKEAESGITYESILYTIKDNEDNVPFIFYGKKRLSPELLIKGSSQVLFNNHPDGIFLIDHMGSIQAVNQSGVKLTGRKEEELLGFKITFLFGENDIPVIEKAIQAAFLNEKEQVKVKSSIRKKSGDKAEVEIHPIPLSNKDQIDAVYMIMQDHTENTRNAQKIEYLALHDPLTGLGNREALRKRLTLLVEQGKEHSHDFALLYMDLDRFKYFNDTFGHQAGDELLRQTASRLNKMILQNGDLYRQGGDEFVMILTDVDRKAVNLAARNILETFQEPFMIREQDYYITPSIGISMFPVDGRDEESLIKNADSALYRVKQKGRGHFQFYRTDMNEGFPNYILMESHLRKAIEKNEFTIHYQPQVNLKTGKTTSFEALLRWNNRKFGNVQPSQFIPLAEETGLIISVGEWVIDTVCKQISLWLKKGYQDIRVAVNISPKQFQQPNLPNVISDALEKYGLAPSYLEIEITEGAMEDTRVTLSMLQRLKELGIIISVDDFGTGYSSLNYLKRFPIDILKIDQSFVKEIQVNEKDAAITKTIIHLAHNLGMEVIAEGVEKLDQVQFLLSAECQKAQGFYFSKPVSAEELEKKLC